MTEPTTKNPDVRYETKDYPPGPVIAAGLLLAVGLAVVGLFVARFNDVLRKWAPAAAGMQAQQPAYAPVRPGLAGWAVGELRAARQRAAAYGWVDRQANLVHIPVERAMELLLEEGFPTQLDAPLAVEPAFEILPAPPLPPVVHDPRGEETPR